MLPVLFFFSGASALIYQLLWFRVLGWVFGVTVYAASTVWGCYMAGLANGSYLAGRLGDRTDRPLRWFATAELLVAVTALLSVPLIDALQRGYIGVYPWLPHSLVALTLVRFAISFAVLIVPTTMMGATLPLVTKAAEQGRGRLGAHLGVLYGSNTAGAVVGTIAAGLYFVPQLGIRRTFFVAAALNAAVGACALVLSNARRQTDSTGSSAATVQDTGEIVDVEDTPARTRRLVLIVFAVSGGVSLALEVVWFRALTLFIRPTVYGFALMLATVLGAIAAGSYAVMPFLDRRVRWIPILAGLELGLGAAILLSFRPLAELPSLSAAAVPWLSRIMPEYLVYPLIGSLLVILPSALLMGIAFPIGLREWASQRSDDPRSPAAAGRIGEFYSLNVGGAIVGSLAAGFLLLPALGSRRAVAVLATLTFASGLALLANSHLARTSRALVAAAATLVFAALLVGSPDPFDQFVAQRYRSDRIVWRDEGIESTVVVHEGRGGRLSLTVNGNHQASTDGSTTYVHRRIGHLPMALHPDPQTALVIGLGGGATAGAVSVHGAQVDVVELSGAVAHAARYFDSINYGVLERPNVHLRVDDGRNHMMLTPRRYDVVTADVIHPIYAGSGNVYSREYFALMRRVLNPGGIAVQWVSGTDAEYKLIARTFLSVFPEATLWADGGLLVGSTVPLRLARADFERKLRDPGRARGLHDLNVESFDALLAAFTAGPDELEAFVGPGPVLTDDKPSVEYFLSLPRHRSVDLSLLKGDVARYVTPD